MGYIIVNRDEDGMEGTRSHMRRMMRGGYHYDGTRPYMRHEGYDHDKMYEMGFRHGWEDADEEHYRRARDSRGRYI